MSEESASIKKKKSRSVTTITGETAKRSQCRLIRKKFYKIGNIAIKDSGDCIKIGDIHYTLEKDRIFWDYSINKYSVRKAETVLHKGIIDKERNMGEFSDHPLKVIVMIGTGAQFYCVNEEIAVAAGFIENWGNGHFYDGQKWNKRDLQQILTPVSSYKNGLDYNIGRSIKRYSSIYHSRYVIPEKKEDIIEHLYENNSVVFDKYTFGIEFETTKGMLPASELSRLGLVPLRDGSVAGIEFVTVPLTGKKGLYTLFEVFNLLNKRTRSDYTCSMHIHIGGLPREESSIMALLYLLFSAQEEIYKLFPSYKFNNDGVKRKNYTSPLPQTILKLLNFKDTSKEVLSKNMSSFIYFLTAMNSNFRDTKLKDVHNHPADPNNDRKWNIRTRYYWVNLIPIIFTNKQTVEFRIFTMPDTFSKLLMFLKIAIGLVEFANRRQKDVISNVFDWDPLSIESILRSVFINDTISQDIRNRKSHLSKLENRGKVIEERRISEKQAEDATRGFTFGELRVQGRRARVMPSFTETALRWENTNGDSTSNS